MLKTVEAFLLSSGNLGVNSSPLRKSPGEKRATSEGRKPRELVGSDLERPAPSLEPAVTRNQREPVSFFHFFS